MKLTEEETKEAEALGFTVVTDSFGHVKSVTKEARNIWVICLHTRDLIFGWQTADLVDGSYCNHKKFGSFSEAINRGA